MLQFKVIKLVAVTTLATTFVVVSSIELAKAQEAETRVGNSYDLLGENQFQVEAQFILFDTAEDGSPIGDQNPASNVGLFVGAVEDYTVGSGTLRQDEKENIIVDPSGNPVFEVPFNPEEKIFDVGDLRAELIENDPEFGRIIQYSILSPELNEVPTFKLVLSNGNISPLTDEQIGFLDDVLPQFPIPNFNEEKAINSIEYILEENLLGLAIEIGEGGVRIALQDEIEEEISEPTIEVPESRAMSSLLIGVVAVSFTLKRNARKS